jgi:A/G-specific adenine glycosylase
MSRQSPPLPPPFPESVLSPSVIRRFRSLVYACFRVAGRSFPWRETREPYHILVSELMLQQTQTERVARMYPPFLARFPTIEKLAASGTRELLEAWRGLGYNRRALALRETARIIVAEHGGVLPSSPRILERLPGIGAATASEIAAFAYDVPHPFIETNIRRVYLYFFHHGRTQVKDREILPLVERTIDRRRPRLWFYALMDYGVMLKGALGASAEPNRRSAHYTKQPPFEGSDRQLRGRILRALGNGEALTGRELWERVGALRDGEAPPYGKAERTRLEGILAKLRDEGFLIHSQGRILLP